MQQELTTWRALLSRASLGVLSSATAVVCLVFLQEITYFKNNSRNLYGAFELIIPLGIFGILLAFVSIAIAKVKARAISSRAAFATGLLAGCAGLGMGLEFVFAKAGIATFILVTLLSPFACLQMSKPKR